MTFTELFIEDNNSITIIENIYVITELFIENNSIFIIENIYVITELFTEDNSNIFIIENIYVITVIYNRKYMYNYRVGC